MAQIERRVTADGKVRWRMRVFVGRDENGNQQFIYKTFDRKGDAEDEARDLERKRSHGVLRKSSKGTFLGYLKRWLKVKASEVRPRTIHDYRGIVRRYIENPPEGAPRLRDILLDRLTWEHFEDLYAWLHNERGLAPRPIEYLHVILRQALDDAVKKGVIMRNPTDHAKRPRRVRDEDDVDEETTVRAMSEEEAARFLKAAEGDRYFALWLLLLTSGLRPGEAYALGWQHVDFEAGRVYVKRTLNRSGLTVNGENKTVGALKDELKRLTAHPDGPRDQKVQARIDEINDRLAAHRGWKLEPPKTKRSRRAVPVPAVTVRALREWKAQQARDRLRLGDEWQDNNVVFTTPVGSPLDESNLSRSNWRRICKRAGLGASGPQPAKPKGQPGPAKKRPFFPAFRIYDLRHTHATLALLKGENIKVVSERLGHASITLTADVYSHVLPDMQEGVVAKFEAMFGAVAT